MESARAAEHIVGEEATDQHEVVVALMARIAGGEREAVWELHDVAEPALRRIVRAEARRIDVRIGDDDVFDLTLDAAVELGKLARSWKPEGAPPWVWARRRITALVHDHVGTFARPLDDEIADAEVAEPVAPLEDPRAILRSLAGRHPSAHRLDQRLTIAVSERDADIWLGVLVEKAAGNRSPAVTVAAEHEMQPAAVRKVVQRVSERLGDVA
jgi:hypothetical protein